MHNQCDVLSGSIVVGDACMEEARYDLKIAPGRYQLMRGALDGVKQPKLPVIRLNDPYVFVMDARAWASFRAWFHRVSNEYGYQVLKVIGRLDEIEIQLGLWVAFYWERDLNKSGSASEGTYQIDPTKLICTGY